MSILEAFLEEKEELGEEIVSLKPSPPSPPSPKQSQHETPARFPARVRGSDKVIETAEAKACWHCKSAKVCPCALCAIPGSNPLTWEPGQCSACHGIRFHPPKVSQEWREWLAKWEPTGKLQ